MKVAVWNILDLVNENGEEPVSQLLSDFSCVHKVNGETVSLNPDIEHFLKHNAVQFAREKKSVSYIVGDEDTVRFSGISHWHIRLFPCQRQA